MKLECLQQMVVGRKRGGRGIGWGWGSVVSVFVLSLIDTEEMFGMRVFLNAKSIKEAFILGLYTTTTLVLAEVPPTFKRITTNKVPNTNIVFSDAICKPLYERPVEPFCQSSNILHVPQPQHIPFQSLQIIPSQTQTQIQVPGRIPRHHVHKTIRSCHIRPPHIIGSAK